MPLKLLSPLLAFCLFAVLATAPVGFSFAASGEDEGDDNIAEEEAEALIHWRYFAPPVVYPTASEAAHLSKPVDGGASALQIASPPPIGQTTFRLTNFGFTVENGEPTFGGKMTKTAWGGLTVPQKMRLVVHTFGSGFNTMLAAYRGTSLANLVQVAADDDFGVAGVSTGESLIQFDAVPGTQYHIQYGGKNGAEGLVAANIFVLPPSGGLSAYLLSVSGVSQRGADYVCSTTSNYNCPAPTFVVHNSTAKTLVVTPSTNLGPGITPPANFTLGPGKLKAVTFIFAPGFDHATPRTVAGRFSFVGREGATIASQTSRPGTVAIKASGTLPDVLRATAVTPQFRAGFINQPLSFELTLTNSGAAAAHGCHLRPYDTNIHTLWQRINPSNGAAIGAVGAPTTFSAKQSQTFVVYLWKSASVFAYLPPDALWRIECADTAPLGKNLQANFDVYGVVHNAPPDILASVLAPTSDTLVVPVAGNAMRIAAVNKGAAGKIEVTAKYEYPFADPANKRFTVTACELASANGACLHLASTSAITYTAAANATHYFKVFVKRPAANPGFNPTTRRVFLNFRAIVPPQNFGSLSVGAESVAPQWH